MEPGGTAFDLRWRMFGTAVRVHPLFWVAGAILGYNRYNHDLRLLLVWILCVFVSILLHEFGHVWMGRAFGSPGYIVLWMMGGLAIGSNSLSRRWQRILVLLAGPGIQLVFYAVLRVGWMLLGFRGASALLLDTLGMLFFINLFWALLNLLPLYPLDGGQITREVCEGVSRHQGLVVSLWISIITGGVLALAVLLAAWKGVTFLPPAVARWIPDDPYHAIFFGIFAAYGVVLLQQANRRPTYSTWEDDLPWER